MIKDKNKFKMLKYKKIYVIKILIIILLILFSISYYKLKLFINNDYNSYKSINLLDIRDNIEDLKDHQIIFNEAIEYAKKNNIKKIIIPEGVYNIYNPINLHEMEGIIIQGVGDVVINYNTEKYYAVNLGSTKNIVIYNIKFINKGQNRSFAIYCGTHSKNIRISSCEFYNSTDVSIKLYNTFNLIIDNNKFIETSNGCIQILNTPKNILIYNNKIEHYTGIAIKIYSPNDYTGRNIFIKSNYIKFPDKTEGSEYTMGIEIHKNNKNIVVEKNLVEGITDMGISLSGTRNIICKYNAIFNEELINLGYGVGLEVVLSKYCIIKNNYIKGDFKRSNIFLDKSNNCTLINNMIIGIEKSNYNNENYILEIDGYDNKILSNRIINGTYGILVHKSSYSNIYINNVLKNSYKPLSLRTGYNEEKDNIYRYNKID